MSVSALFELFIPQFISALLLRCSSVLFFLDLEALLGFEEMLLIVWLSMNMAKPMLMRRCISGLCERYTEEMRASCSLNRLSFVLNDEKATIRYGTEQSVTGTVGGDGYSLHVIIQMYT